MTALFVLLVVYQLKHFLADYIFQGEYMLGKFKPGWTFVGPLLAHVAVHGAMTLLIAVTSVIFMGATDAYFVLTRALAIAGLDVIVHFFMDRIKAGPRYMGRWKALSANEFPNVMQELKCDVDEHAAKARKRLRDNVLFWWALGFDQMVHHLTHYACILLILLTAGVL